MFLVLKAHSPRHSASRILRLIQRKTNHNRQANKRAYVLRQTYSFEIYMAPEFDMPAVTTFRSPPHVNTAKKTSLLLYCGQIRLNDSRTSCIYGILITILIFARRKIKRLHIERYLPAYIPENSIQK